MAVADDFSLSGSRTHAHLTVETALACASLAVCSCVCASNTGGPSRGRGSHVSLALGGWRVGLGDHPGSWATRLNHETLG